MTSDTETAGAPATGDGPDTRVALTGGGLQIRRKGQPLRTTVFRQGAVYLVVDCSSSMEGHKIVQASEGALRFAVEAIGKSYIVGLIAFSSRPSRLCEPQGDVARLKESLPHLQADGTTNMASGIDLATESLKGKHHTLAMVVVTDGVPDDKAAALTAARRAKEIGIDVMTVGTDDADEAFLKKLASRSDLSVVVDNRQIGEGIGSAAKMLTGPYGIGGNHV